MKILHLQIPSKRIKAKDSFAITPQLLGDFMNFIKEKMGDEFTVIASPCVPSLLSDEDIVYNFDMKEIKLAEIKELIKSS